MRKKILFGIGGFVGMLAIGFVAIVNTAPRACACGDFVLDGWEEKTFFERAKYHLGYRDTQNDQDLNF